MTRTVALMPLLCAIAWGNSIAQPVADPSECNPKPPATTPAVKAGTEIHLRLLRVDNTLQIDVDGNVIDKVDERPPTTGSTAPPKFVALGAVMSAPKTYTLTLTGWNERCIHQRHCNENPWEFTYQLVAGPQSAATPLFPVVTCKGNRENSKSTAKDIHVITHKIAVPVSP